MNVPITSDLQGYTAFWRDQVGFVLVLFTIGWSVIVVLLGAILLTIRGGRDL